MKMYAKVDTFLSKLKRLVRKEFDRQASFQFDQLNAGFVKKETRALYQRLKRYNRENYLEIAQEGAEWALEALPASLKEKYKARLKNVSTGEIVASTLAAYNFVTGYLYESEAERKRMRQAEEMLTAGALYTRSKYRQVMDRSAKLWYQQSAQYAIDVEDEAVLTVWRTAGIEEVEWVAEDDDKTCKICRDRDGKHYSMDAIPPKPHYNCRCTWRPVWTEKS